jgi:hypothetical protein
MKLHLSHPVETVDIYSALRDRVTWLGYSDALLQLTQSMRDGFIETGLLQESTKATMVSPPARPLELDGNYTEGYCHFDARKTIATLVQHHKMDVSSLSVLTIGYATVNSQEWLLHFAVFDKQNGLIYDPSFSGSNDVNPVPVSEYFSRISDKYSSGNRTVVKVIDPLIFEKEINLNPIQLFYVFGQGLEDKELDFKKQIDYILKNFKVSHPNDYDKRVNYLKALPQFILASSFLNSVPRQKLNH